MARTSSRALDEMAAGAAISTLIRNATIVTMNDAPRHRRRRRSRSATAGSSSVGAEPSEPHETVIDAGGAYLLPGFIQTHVHLCQTLFRGYADDMPLLEWLRRRVWPMEAAHTPARFAPRRGSPPASCSSSGTTTALTMETVHDTDVVFEALDEMGLRAVVGKCMMDSDQRGPAPAAGADARVDRRKCRAAQALGRQGETGGCARRSRRASRSPARANCSKPSPNCRRASGVIVHTHASENRDEVEVVRRHFRRHEQSRVPRGHRSGDPAPVHGTLRMGHRRASRRCSPSATSRSCTAPART